MTADHKKRARITSEERAAIIARLRIFSNAKQVAKETGKSYGVIRKVAGDAEIALKGKRLSPEQNQKLIADIAESLNAAHAAALNGVSKKTAWRKAKSAGIEIGVKSEIGQLLKIISGGMRIEKLAGLLEFNSLKQFVVRPEHYSHQWVEEKLIPRLMANFPDKKQEIRMLEALLYQPRISVAQMKGTTKKGQQDFREAAGLLLKELRTNCEQPIDSVRGRLKQPIVQRNLERIEAGDTKLAASIYRDAIKELCGIYKQIAPEIAGVYMPQLQNISSHLKR